MRCPECAAPVADPARFCPSCGTRLTTEPTMPAARKVVTLLFCDLVESTQLSDRLDPEPLRALMLRYFDAMCACVERYGGTVEKFIGDAIMAVFGIPTLHEDDALRAVRAAADMRDALDDPDSDLTAGLGLRLAIRVGVNTGEVVTSAGPASSTLASGEPVNVAARLQAKAAPGEILLGPETYHAVAGAVVAEPVGRLALKGKTEPVPAYRLVELDPDAPALPRRTDGPFIGRDPHLADLTAALDRVRRDRCCVLVSVFGDAGVGKSRLVREFGTLAGTAGAVVGAGRCRPFGEGGTLLPLAEALRPLAGALEDEPDPDAREALGGLRAGLLRDGSPGRSVEETLWSVGRLLAAAGREQPVVLVLDDLQWAGPLLLDAVDQLTTEAGDVPVLLVCLARPELLDARPGWGSGKLNAVALSLPPLGADDARLLADALVEVSGHDAAVLDRIVARAEGNPLFIEQVVAMMRAGGSADVLPTTVQALVAARLEALKPAERDLLQAASVVVVAGARDVPLPALAALAPAGADLDAALRVLVHRRLLARPHTRGGSPVYRFSHVLVQEVAYAGAAKQVRADRHVRLADWLADRDGGPDVVGAHLERAFRLHTDLRPVDEDARRLRDRAATTLAGAGGLALGSGDLPWAADLLERALALASPDDPRLLAATIALGDVRLATGRVEAGRDLLRRAEACARATGDEVTAAHARLQLSFLDAGSTGFGPVAVAARALLPVFEAAADQLGIVRCWLRIGQAEQVAGRYGPSLGALERALAAAVLADAELERATVLGALAVSWWLGPEPVDAAIDRCRALLDEHGEGRRAVRAALSCPLAVLVAMNGDVVEGRALVDVAERILAELGHAFGAASVPVFGATVEALAGDWTAAEALLRSASAAAFTLGDRQLLAAVSRDTARVLLALGRPDDALVAVSLAEDNASSAGAELAALRARVLAARGETDGALRLVELAALDAELTDSPVAHAMFALDRAYLLADLGDPIGAGEAAAEAERQFAVKGHRVGVEWARALR